MRGGENCFHGSSIVYNTRTNTGTKRNRCDATTFNDLVVFFDCTRTTACSVTPSNVKNVKKSFGVKFRRNLSGFPSTAVGNAINRLMQTENYFERDVSDPKNYCYCSNTNAYENNTTTR